ncbi:hypothetical protein LFX25_14345 [Leptospira sp. FAT2]|uniref:hypothetical protein n=1 Tax=Leptospira sanjuanensis TaxID=2879643 RepID=UPI001EE83263|nr:hypothetical protein [Leptospira sanjuanensis]MCG6194423.1 hypothetical protein [Leptospira sanjuanensis]
MEKPLLVSGKKTYSDAVNFVENPMRLEIYEEAADLFRFCKSKGISIRSGIDFQIAVCAIRNRLTVFHRDPDFSRIAKLTNLKQKEILT